MNKLLSLLLAAALCLCTLLPAAAQSPDAMDADLFKERYSAFFTACFPGNAITWITQDIDGQEAWGALMNDALPMAMFLVEDGLVSRVIVNYTGTMDEQSVYVFVLQCCLVGGTLQPAESADPLEIVGSAMDELAARLGPALQSGDSDFSLWGAQASYLCIPQEAESYSFVLDLILPQSTEAE